MSSNVHQLESCSSECPPDKTINIFGPDAAAAINSGVESYVLSYELCVLYPSTRLFIRLSDAALIKLINDGINADKRRGGVLVKNDWNLSGIVLMAFHLSDCFQASGPPVQNEPVDLSVRVVAPVAAQVIVNGGKSIGITLSWYD